jgi:hypothetical protein
LAEKSSRMEVSSGGCLTVQILMTLILALSLSSCENPMICGDFLLGGYEQLHPYEGAPLHVSRWKAYRFQAVRSGEANCFKVFVKGLLGDRSDDEVGYAIYKDANDSLGALMVSGYEPHYNWEIIGTWASHAFPLARVHTASMIEAGSYYWITMQSSGAADILVERGHPTDCIPGSKRGADHSSILIPPDPEEFNIVFGEDCYGWSVW